MSKPLSPRKPRRRLDYRWLRSNGTPDFADHIHEAPGDMELLAKKPVISVTPTTPIGKAIEVMVDNYRSLIVAVNNYLKGLLLATHIVNYLGGGEYFKIIENKYSYNIFSAFNKEFVEHIMESKPIVAYVDEKLPSILEKIVVHSIGLMPVVYRDNRLYGVISEHDLIKYLRGIVKIGVEVSKIMSSPVITIDSNSTIKQAMEKMITNGFRRLPVIEDGQVIGIVTVIDIIRFFDPRRIFKKIIGDDIREVLKTMVNEIMSKELVIVYPDDDLSIAINRMLDKNVSSALVVDHDMKLLGIITERDILYALTVKEIK